MKYIDLRKEYPHLDATYSEYPVSYKIDAMFEQCRLAEQALEKRRSRNGDVVSLDSEPGVEAHILERVPGPEEEAMKHIQNEVVIPPKRNRKEQRQYDRYLYRLRHLVENAFLILKRWRGIATRYAKNTASFLAAVQIRCIAIWCVVLA